MSQWIPYYELVVPRIGGLLSCTGSGYILQDVLRNPDVHSNSIYRHIMLGLSTMDILSSLFFWFIGSWAMPKGSGPASAGNMTTCDIAAVLGFVGTLGSTLYNGALSTYFLLQLKYNWVDRRMEEIEKWLHIVPCAIPLLGSIPIFAAKMFGPSDGRCSISMPYRRGCDTPGSEGECVRGNIDGKIVASPIFLVNVMCIIYVAVSMFAVFKAVRDIERNALKYSFVARFYERDKRKTMKRSKRVMIQGILYSATMLLLFLFGFANIIYSTITKKKNVILSLIFVTICPLQGLFNFFIYLIPVFRKMLKTYKRRKNNTDSMHVIISVPPIEILRQEEKNAEINSEEKEEEKKTMSNFSVIHAFHQESNTERDRYKENSYIHHAIVNDNESNSDNESF